LWAIAALFISSSCNWADAGIGPSEEELVFDSPALIQESWKDNVINQARQQEALGAEVTMACKRGIMTCLWEDDNIMVRRAEGEAQTRGLLKPGMSAKKHDAKTVGLPALSKPKDLYQRPELLMLAGPAVGGTNTNLIDGKVEIEAGATGEMQLTVEMTKYLESLEVMEGVAQGAVVKSEALPFGNFTDVIRRAERHVYHQYERRNYRFLNDPIDSQWQLAMDFQETNRTKLQPYNMTHEQELMEWFTKGGGQLSYVGFHRDDDGEPLYMVAEESVSQHDVVLQVPMKLTMGRQTQRLVQTKRGLLKEHFDKIFQRNEEWGLAAFLLYEQLKGMDSKWAPFIRMLKMRVLRRDVMKELQGTYAAELYRQWDAEATHLLAYMRDNSDGPCRHDFNGLCTGMLERSFLRWALWVVKRYAVPVRKLTTGKPFLALVPFAHLVTHDEGAGGNITLFLDNTIRLSVTSHNVGSAIVYDKGNYSSAEILFRFHQVPKKHNPHNAVQLALPGVSTEYDDLIHLCKRTKDWREMLRFPPSQIDLWIATNHLMIYGDQDDEEEQKVLQNLNNLFEGKPVQVASEAEYLMLMGGASDATEAALILSGNEGALADYKATRDPMLYVAIDVEKEGDSQDRALDTLSFSLFQFQDAMIANSESESVQKVINRTRDFYVHGVRPLRGFDEVDKMMKRMKQVLDLCGNYSVHVIKNGNVSDNLFCAMRIHLVNESDLDAICPAGPYPFNDGECNCAKKDKAASIRDCDEYEIYFNTSLPICRKNEESSILALINSLEALQSGYPTSIDDDESLLMLSTVTERTPLYAAAVSVRLQEKLLVRDTLKALRERLEMLDELPYQVEEMRRRQELRREMEEKKKAENELMRKKAMEPKLVVSVPVDMGEAGSHNISVYEGQELEAVAKEFVANHTLKAEAVQILVDAVKKKIPEQAQIELAVPFLDPYGIRRVVSVYQGLNATNVTQEICISYNISDDYDDPDCVGLVQKVEKMYEKRIKYRVLMTMPVSLADGRDVQLQVREGDHHDLISLVTNLAAVYRIPEGYIYGIANEIHKRLPREVANVPVNIPGRTLQLSIRQGEDIEKAVTVFCEVYDLPLENVPNLRQMVLQKMNPDVGFVARGKQA